MPAKSKRRMTWSQARMAGPAGLSTDALDILSYFHLPATARRIQEFIQPARGYLDYLSLQKKRAPTTIIHYARDINNFLSKFLIQSRNLDIGINNVDEDMVLEYSKWLIDSGLHSSARARYISTLNGLFKWMTWKRLIRTNPMAYVESVPIDPVLPRPFSIEELAKIFNAFGEDSYHSIRMFACIELMYGSGARQNEVARLKFGDLNIREEGTSFVRLYGKGHKERDVPLTNQFIAALNRYLLLRGRGTHKEYVFLTRQSSYVSGKTLEWQMREVGKRTGIIDCKCHRLRHSFATHMYANGCPLEILQKLMGHVQAEMTLRYTKIAPQKAFEEYRKADIRGMIERWHQLQAVAKGSTMR